MQTKIRDASAQGEDELFAKLVEFSRGGFARVDAPLLDGESGKQNVELRSGEGFVDADEKVALQVEVCGTVNQS